MLNYFHQDIRVVQVIISISNPLVPPYRKVVQVQSSLGSLPLLRDVFIAAHLKVLQFYCAFLFFIDYYSRHHHLPILQLSFRNQFCPLHSAVFSLLN